MKVVFFGGKPTSGRCLEKLVAVGVDVVGVVTRPRHERGWWSGPGVEEVWDTAWRLETPVFEEASSVLLGADLGISVLYHRVLPAEIVNGFPAGIQNFHPAPLPYYRGANAISHALMKGETKFGVSVHYMDEKVDHGPLIEVLWFDIGRELTARQVMARTELAIEELERKAIEPYTYSKVAEKILATARLLKEQGR